MNVYEQIDRDHSIRQDDPQMRILEEEMIRSHALCLKISAMKPTDPGYKELLEELFQTKVDDSLAIVSPFYCDCGRRLKLGKNIIINKGATILPPGIVEIEDNVQIVTVDHDLEDRHNLYHFGKVTIKNNAWLGIGVTIGKNSVVAAGSVVTEDVPDNTMVGGVPAKIIKKL